MIYKKIYYKINLFIIIALILHWLQINININKGS